MKHLTTILKPRQHELEARLDPAWQPETEAPVVGTGNLYELGEKVRSDCRWVRLIIEGWSNSWSNAIRPACDELDDTRVHVFDAASAVSTTCGTTCLRRLALQRAHRVRPEVLEDIDRLRNDVDVPRTAVGARRHAWTRTSIPAGDLSCA